MWFDVTPGAAVVLDATGPMGMFAAKLLRDLGVSVTSVERGVVGGMHERDRALERAQLQFLRDDGPSPGVTSLGLGVRGSSCVLWDETSPIHRAELESAIRDARADGWPGSLIQIAALGSTGPYAGFRSNDLLLNALGGITFVSGSPDDTPCTPPESQAYYFTSAWSALLAVTDAYAASVDKTRRGRHDAEVVAYEAVATQEQIVRSWGSDGEIIRREGSQHKRVSPASIYPTADGYVYLMVSKVHWRTFLAAWDGHPEELEDPVWESNEHRRARATTLNRMLEPFVRRSTVDEFVAAMQSVGIPCLPVYTPRQLLADTHMRSRPLFIRPDEGEAASASLRLPLIWSPPDCAECTADLGASGVKPAEHDTSPTATGAPR